MLSDHRSELITGYLIYDLVMWQIIRDL